MVQALPLYIQEKVHPKVLVDDLLRRTEAAEKAADPQPDLFADFNGLADENATTEFYQHDVNWTNRMILGDSLQVMASLAEREGLRGKVQCIYLDPPYGIKFNSNFQWSTTSMDVKDGSVDHITRELEQVKAFRDTWRNGIHSYLTYLRDRLTVSRDLLTETGSIFVQVGDENVHRVRALMDEVFGDSNAISIISYPTSIGLGSQYLDNVNNYLVWYAKDRDAASRKFRRLFRVLELGEAGATRYTKIRDIDTQVHNVSTLNESKLKTIVGRGGSHRRVRLRGLRGALAGAHTQGRTDCRHGQPLCTQEQARQTPHRGGWSRAFVLAALLAGVQPHRGSLLQDKGHLARSGSSHPRSLARGDGPSP